MTDLQASLGLHQLARIEENLAAARGDLGRYDAAFAGLPVTYARARGAGHAPRPPPLHACSWTSPTSGVGRDACSTR